MNERPETKLKILDSAQELIQKVGVNGMSYSDLSEVVGIRKASIHHHFPKKDDLIVALLDRCCEEYSDLYQNIGQSAGSTRQKLEQLIDIFNSTMLNGKICLVGMLSVELEALNDAIQTQLAQVIECTTKIIEVIFKQGVDNGSFHSQLKTYESAYGFHCFLLGSQILTRPLTDKEAFVTSTTQYINGILN